MAERDLLSIAIQIKGPSGVRTKVIWLKTNEEIVGVLVGYQDNQEKVWPRAMAIRNRMFPEHNEHAFGGKGDDR